MFLDLTAAFDTVCHEDVLLKISNCLPAWLEQNLLDALLRDRRYRVHVGDDVSSWRTHRNGLLQGCVLLATLFVIFTNDFPEATSRKFGYADDYCFQAQTFLFREFDAGYGACDNLLHAMATNTKSQQYCEV